MAFGTEAASIFTMGCVLGLIGGSVAVARLTARRTMIIEALSELQRHVPGRAKASNSLRHTFLLNDDVGTVAGVRAKPFPFESNGACFVELKVTGILERTSNGGLKHTRLMFPDRVVMPGEKRPLAPQTDNVLPFRR